jgi:SEC-C motif-containing protein
MKHGVTVVRCDCESGRAYAECCGPLHEGAAVAPTAEALMRSRYSAYARRLEPYLLATWHASTRPAALNLAQDTATRWLGLKIRRHEMTGKDSAIVEFVARFRVGGGSAQRMEEVSRFLREDDGRWYYVDGDVS